MKWTALPSGEMEVRVASARLSYGATWSSVVLRSSTAVVRADLQKLLFPSELLAIIANVKAHVDLRRASAEGHSVAAGCSEGRYNACFRAKLRGLSGDGMCGCM